MNKFSGLTYFQSIAAIADEFSERNALTFGSRRWTFKEAKREIDGASARLASLDLRPQDKVGIWMPNRPEAIWYWLGASQMGCVAVFFNTRLTQDEIAYQILQSDTRALVVAGPDGHRDYLVDLTKLCPELATQACGALSSASFPELRHVVCVDRPPVDAVAVHDWSDPPDAGLSAPGMESDPDAPALIVYSSGTTALPKGVVLTHSVWRKAYDHGIRFSQTEEDRLWLCMPLFGIMANVNGVLTFWSRGSSIVLEDRFEPQSALRAIQDQVCTTAYLMPVMLDRILAQANFREFDLSRLRTGTVVTNDPDVMIRAIDELGMTDLYSTYGMSELSSVVLRSFANDPLDVKLNSHGSPMPDIEVRIADPDTGDRLPPGREGEIQIRGYNVMPGYYRKAEETAAAFTSDGWFRTGDSGVERADGNFRFIARLNDGYKYNGFNVSTREVEAALQRHPDVASAAVVGIADPIAGEIGVAFVVARPGHSIDTPALSAFLKPVLAPYKRPQRIVLLDELPLTAGTGKVQTRRLKAMARDYVKEERARTPA